MRRVAHYRRSGRKMAYGGVSPYAGLREKIVWALSPDKRMTGAELAERFGLTLSQFNKCIGAKFLNDQTSQVTGGEQWTVEGTRTKDRYYWLAGKPRYLAPKVTKEKTLVISKKTRADDDTWRENTARAERRARLIKAGLYINEFEAVL